MVQLSERDKVRKVLREIHNEMDRVNARAAEAFKNGEDAYAERLGARVAGLAKARAIIDATWRQK